MHGRDPTAYSRPVELLGDSPHWIWVFLGRLHPLVVHFPIALVLCAALGELLGRLVPERRRAAWPGGLRGPGSGPSDAVLFCLVLGAASAGLATGLGWLNAAAQTFTGGSAETLWWHRAFGFTAAGASIATAALALRLRRAPRAALDRLYLAGLLASAIGVSGAGHFGGSLVFGSDYLTSALPGADAAATTFAELPPVARPVDFARDVRPIFEESCFGCHGPEKQKGRLRLDARHLAIDGGKSGKAIVAGDPEASLLLRRVMGAQGSERRMPVDDDPLTPEQIALVHAWIEDGAEWPDEATVADATLAPHWAYVTPRRPAPPALDGGGWVRGPIDAFVLARMRAEGLTPAPEAGRAALIRRVSLDLTGLPPTPEEVEAFERDPRPDAYDRVVDRLLASPHYGEKWARHWLDLARYADSEGHDQDNGREIWHYRDWVVSAFNRDLPFDRFTLEQIAGDLLPDATRETRVATGFHRNTMFNREAGVDPDEAHWEVLVDRVGTTGTVWLGSTLACAQCHDHKYDPFTQADFYSFLAFFNGAERHTRTVTFGNNPPVVTVEEPVLDLPTPAQQAALERLRAKLAALEAQATRTSPEIEADERLWEAQVRAAEAEWVTLEADALASSGGSTLEHRADGSILVSGENPPTDSYRVGGPAPPGPIRALRLELLPDESLPGGGPGRFHDGGFVITGFEALLVAEGAPPRPLPFEAVRADASSPYHEVQLLVQRGAGATRFDGWSAPPGVRHQVTFALARPVRVAPGERIEVRLHHGRGVVGRLGTGRFRVSVSASKTPFATLEVPEAVRAALALPREERSASQAETVARHHREAAPRLAGVRDEIEKTRRALGRLGVATTLVMADAPRETPLSARVRKGGAYSSPSARVPAAVPDFLPPLPEGSEADRLGLARWLTDPDNPLVARVTVNRYWEQLFGAGLVRTVDDFGTRGEEPTHPELLDWLAREFVESGFRVKAMHRAMVTSATYRQSSVVDAVKRARDPDNRWLARATRRRLPAEHIRDAALAATGLLDRTIGGHPVFPYQPEGVWRFALSEPKLWRTSDPPDRYRRGLYTYWRRTAVHPQLTVFDAPSREVCTGRREPTNTPMQALAQLNEPTVIDAARHLARRLVALPPPKDDRARARLAFRSVLSREPEPGELDRLVDYVDSERRHFGARPVAAARLARPATEDGDGAASADDDPATAAWTLLVAALLNTDEAINTP